MDLSLLDDFSSPSSKYRGKPFWAWNNKLEEKELRAQIRLMHKMGFGGFFMHARVGLDTAYLSEDWFRCINACIDEAKKLGLEAWLYDEDRWPSGAAGGLVTKNPDYRMRSLHIEIFDTVPSGISDDGLVGIFTGKIVGSSIFNTKLVTKDSIHLSNEEKVILFRRVINTQSDWFNGNTYLDTMNHEAVQEFIKVTHDLYKEKIGEFFGNVVPGIFTDEPNYYDRGWTGDKPVNTFPWTDKLPKTFENRYGYDLIEHLPEVFFDLDGQVSNQPRHHYHDCITHMFVDAFSRQIGEWCGKNNMIFTGHVLAEEMLSSQTNVVGSSLRFYEHMQAPGMDLLTQHNREYDTAKCVASVARQMGRPWRITETYGCSGWDFPWAGHKALGDWQAALGINIRCHHLAWYTMEGEAKRDYPAAIFYQSPWWEQYRYVEDYFSRINVIMTRGEEIRDVLVIHPVESMWQKIRYGWNLHSNDIQETNRSFIKQRDAILSCNIDFDYGDEEMLSRLATVHSANGNPVVTIGRASYTTIIVSESSTIRSTTLALIEKFLLQGGKVLFNGVPSYVDGVASDKAKAIADKCTVVNSLTELQNQMNKYSRRISITDNNGKEIAGILHLLREDSEAYYLFVNNTGYEEWKTPEDYPVGDERIENRTAEHPYVKITVFTGCKGMPVECNPISGKFTKAQAISKDSQVEISTSLPKLGSRLFIIPKKELPINVDDSKIRTVVKSNPIISKKWDVQLSEANVCVLDKAIYRIGDTGEFNSLEEVLRLDTKVRTTLGIPGQGGGMKQPWAREKNSNPKSTPVTLMYSFGVKDLPSGDLLLAIERPELYSIHINGIHVETARPVGYWVDLSLKTLRLDPSTLHKGENRLEINCNYNENHPGLEIVYLLGSFGVEIGKSSVALTKWDNSLSLGDWTLQGLPFYSGAVTYLTELSTNLKENERLLIKVPEFKGSLVNILVNGKPSGIIAWEPQECDITDSLKGEKNLIGIQVISHRRNSHGPLHHTNKQVGWTGPAEFRSEGDSWTDDYSIVECGLTKEPEVVIVREE